MYAGTIMTLLRPLQHLVLAGAMLLAISGCTTVKKTLTVIPGMGGPSGDSVSAEDPVVPFNASSVLGYGHTLRLAIYDGAIEPSRLFNGLVMIDRQGVADFGKFGSARLGGHTLVECSRLIESVFRRNGQAGGRVHVHYISVENTPLITVEGDVRTPLIMPLYKGMTVHNAVAQAGGRRPGSAAQAVYVTQNGIRRFYQTEALADYGSPLRAGDIITLSPDL
jgi:protein involved in polysaccharide export with SLBB domain